MSENVRVVIIGGGIVGCSAARELALAGASVTIVERGEPGCGATRAAAGILSPQDIDCSGPLLELALASRESYPKLVEELLAESGIDPCYRTSGALSLAFDDEDEEEFEQVCERQMIAGLPVERVPAGRIHALEPAVNRAVRQGLLFPYDHQVDNVLLIKALAASARRRGARFLLGRRVSAIEAPTGGDLAIRLEDGEKITFDRVIVAAGCWSGQIDGLPEKLPVHPVKGQMVVLDTGQPLLRHVLLRAGRYLVPRGDGRTLVGSTIENAGFDDRVTAGGIGGLLSHATHVVPALADAPIRETWAGLRPATRDGLPIIGASTAPGVIYATGLYRSGILMGPLSGRLAAQLAIDGRSPVSLDAFSPLRFARD